jgi:hypothetical protein
MGSASHTIVRLNGKTICVTHTITDYKDKAEIIVDKVY